MSRYVVAVVATAAVVGVRWLLSGLLADHAPLTPCLVAVVVAGYYGGWKPAFLATALCAVAGVVLFMGSAHTADRLHVGVFVAEGVLIGWMCEGLHAARRRIQREKGRRQEGEERLGLTLDSAGMGTWDWNPATGDIQWSARTRELFGVDAAMPVSFDLFVSKLHPDDVGPNQKKTDEAAATGEYENEYRVMRPGGGFMWIATRGRMLRDDQGQPTRMLGVVTDITARKQAETFLAGQKSVFELVAADRPLPDVLGAVCKFIEHQEPGLLCAVLLPDDKRRHIGMAVGPSLPDAYMRELVGLKIGPPYIGSRGTVLDCGEPVVVPDVRAYEQFAPEWRELLLSQGLRSCRSVPVFGSDGTVLASFAIYRRETGDPAPANAELLQTATHLAGIAIERKRSEEQVRASEEKYRTLFNSLDEAVTTLEVIFDDSGRVVDWRMLETNPATTKMTGWTNEVVGKKASEYIPGEIEAFWFEAVERVVKTGEPVRVQHPVAGLNDNWYEMYLARVGGEGSRQIVCVYNNITERKRSEQEREATQRTLAAVVERCPFGIYIVDDEFRITSMNDGSQQGAFANVRPVIGRPLDEAISILWPEPIAADIIRNFRHTLDTGEPYYSRDFVNPRADINQTEGYEWELHRITLPSGRHGVVCYYYDSTNLRRAEEQFRMMADNISQLAWVCDTLGNVTWYNKRWLDYTGLSFQEMKGWDWSKVQHPDHLDRVVKRVQRSAETGEPWDDTFPLRGKDGNYRWFLSRAVPIRDEAGRITCWFGTNTDITEQRHVEQQLREAEGRFRTMADAAPALIWQTDGGGVTFVNRHYLDFFGQPLDALAGLGWADYLHPDDGGYLTAYRTAFAQQKEYEYHARFRRHDGEYRWLHNIGTPHHGPDGAFIGFIGCSFDVTDSRRAAEALQDADRKKDEFLATLAHELRNPLAPLRNGLQIMKLAGGDAGAVEKARGMMDRQVGQMAHLIDDLMDLSRISRGKIVLQKTRLRLAEVVQDAVDTARPLIEERGHELVVDVPPAPLYVDADRTRLAQVFGNLLNNAAKYTEMGGRIRLAVERQGSDVVVAVEDNGVGIPAHMLTRVFDMFAQVDRSLEKSQGGLGIGLNIVKRLVEMHDGSIVAESGGHGAGSRFVVRLPVVLALASEEPGDVVCEGAKPAARRRILVADDNQDAASSLAMLLGIMGNETQTAHDGLEALDVGAAFKPDVVLLDIGMPKLNGLDACRRIREQTWGRNIVIVACTGWGQEDDRRQSKEAGFDFHMVKPVDPAALEKLLAELKATTG